MVISLDKIKLEKCDESIDVHIANPACFRPVKCEYKFEYLGFIFYVHEEPFGNRSKPGYTASEAVTGYNVLQNEYWRVPESLVNRFREIVRALNLNRLDFEKFVRLAQEQSKEIKQNMGGDSLCVWLLCQ